jgi:plastocyanin
MKRLIALLALCGLCSWPLGAAAAGTPKTYVIAIDLDIPAVSTPHGKTLGYAPMETDIHVGDSVRFINVDDEAHTATAAGITDFRPHGARLSQPWSTGSLSQEQSSRLFLADKPGIYRYGCRYHVAEGQRAVIVVTP